MTAGTGEDTRRAPGDPWIEGGAVEQACRGQGVPYLPRTAQREYAGAIAEALRRQAPGRTGILTIEAGTGVGKTLGYLVPCAIHAAQARSKVLVSTHTIALGDQIMRRDGRVALAVASALTGHTLRLAHMRGRSHYISPSRALSTGNLMRGDGLPRLAWEPYLAIAAEASKAAEEASEAMEADRLDEACGALVEACLLDRIEEAHGIELAREDVCLLRSSPADEKAVHALGRRLAGGADILVTTHAYTALALARRSLFGSAEDPFDSLVVDEADQWAGAAASVSLVKASVASMLRSIQNVLAAARQVRNGEDLCGLATATLTNVESLAAMAPQGKDLTVAVAADGDVLSVMRKVTDGMDAIHTAASRRRSHMAAAVDAMASQAEDLRRIQEAIKRNSDFWSARWTTSRVEGAPSIGVAAQAPGRIMKRLWTTAEGVEPLAMTVVLTSATLVTPGFGEQSRWKGIEIATGASPSDGNVLADLARIVQPTDFGRMRVRFADPRAPVPRLDDGDRMDPEAVAYAAEVIAAARRDSSAREGRTLVLVPAYADVLRLAPLVPGCLAHAQGRSLQDVLAEYRRTPECCLLTPAAWVGADLPGLVQNLVIPRLPFRPRASGPEGGMAGAMSDVLCKLSQGIGRAIRGAGDDATVWFADPRMPIPESVTEDTGLMPHRSANAAMLAAIPERFRARFGRDPDAAAIGVAHEGVGRSETQANRRSGKPRAMRTSDRTAAKGGRASR